MQVIDTCFLRPFSWRWFEWFDEGIRPYVTGMPKINSLQSKNRIEECTSPGPETGLIRPI
jgi:hypothetical protein